MKYSSIFFLWFLWMSGLYSCRTRDCNSIPETFSSYSEAINRIKNSSFVLTDSIAIENNLLMTSAQFFSCDGMVGYFFYTKDKENEFFCKGVPIEVWTRFKKASMKDSFYYKNIYDKYTSVIIKVNLDSLSH
jgi:hypothetical protein